MNIKITAIAAGVALAASVSTAYAFSFGEVWVGDQQDGKLYIFDQAELNDPSFDAVEDIIDLTTLGGANSTRMHLIGFTNHSGLNPNSRAHLAYLGGQMDILKTNGGTHAPTLVDSLQVSSSSLHMCGGNPQNTEIACSSIGQKQLVKVSQDPHGGDVHNIIGSYPLADLKIAKRVRPGTVARDAIDSAIADGILNGVPICNNYSTNGKLLYVTVKGSPSGVLVLNSRNMKIRDAFAGTAVGCGLVNSKDGKYMWTNAGSKDPADDEKAYKFKFRHAYNNNKTGPVKTVDLPETAEEGGDVHGAQFAGIGGFFLWQVMRLDDDIHVIEPRSARVVNTIDLETDEVANPAADVLDRSAFGTRMYASLRGAVPTTAITGNNDPTRTPGVMVLGTFFGYHGVQLKTEAILSGNVAEFCPEAVDGDGEDGDEHVHYELCGPRHPHYDEVIEADTADPHGLKSLNYLSGGF
ncbi:MAG: hypothetical protein JKX75_01980 [Gammaproteobacteria bacterium]|nr:hypothetical protein [Gammaproteobacteria bacterium]